MACQRTSGGPSSSPCVCRQTVMCHRDDVAEVRTDFLRVAGSRSTTAGRPAKRRDQFWPGAGGVPLDDRHLVQEVPEGLPHAAHNDRLVAQRNALELLTEERRQRVDGGYRRVSGSDGVGVVAVGTMGQVAALQFFLDAGDGIRSLAPASRDGQGLGETVGPGACGPGRPLPPGRHRRWMGHPC